MGSFYAELSDKDKETVKAWSERAKSSEHKRDIPPEYYIGAKLGFYYGWQALLAFKLGYVVGLDDNGKPIKIPYTFNDAVADVRSAEKVNYRQLIDNGDIIASANIASRDTTWARNTIQRTNEIRKEING